MRTFNEGKQVAPSDTEQWTIDPIPEHMMGAAFVFDSFTPPDLSASPFNESELDVLLHVMDEAVPPNGVFAGTATASKNKPLAASVRLGLARLTASPHHLKLAHAKI